MSLVSSNVPSHPGPEQVGHIVSFNLGSDPVIPFQTQRRDVASKTSREMSPSRRQVSCDVSRMASHNLSHDFCSILAEGDERMQALVSNLREVQESLLKQAEIDIRQYAAQHRTLLKKCFEEALKPKAESSSMSSVTGGVSFTDTPEIVSLGSDKTDCSLTHAENHGNTQGRNSGASTRSSASSREMPTVLGKFMTISSELSSATKERRDSLRRGYAGLSKSNVREESLFTRLMSSVAIAFSSLFNALGKRRFNFDRVGALVNSKEFVALVCSVIFANAAFIGVTSDQMVKDSFQIFDGKSISDTGRATDAMEMIFNAAFGIELLLRLVALEGQFFIGVDWTWNVFDSFLVVSSVVELYLQASEVNFSFIRVLRLFRIIRTLRVVRLLRFATTLKNLRLMILAIIKSSGPLVFATGILLTLMFLVAVLVLHGVTSYVDQSSQPSTVVDEMNIYFSSMPMTLLTLFMSITGGVNWWEVERLLLRVHIGYGIIFVVYIAVMFLGVLNIITGIFVNDAVEMASSDDDMMLQNEKDMRVDQVKKLKELFSKFDANQDQVLTLDEFEDQLLNPEVQVTLAKLGLEVSEAKLFFQALDVDKSGDVEIDEFVMGCMNLKGKTKLIDIEGTLNDTRRMVKKILERQGQLRFV